jgi:hypothetical protein
MEIFEWKDRVDYNVLYGRIVRLSIILAELHLVNASYKFRAKSLEQLAEWPESYGHVYRLIFYMALLYLTFS